MALVAYWIYNRSITWPSGTLTGPHIKDHLLADGITSAEFYGQETVTDTSTGIRTISEATPITGYLPNTDYKLAWVVYDDVALTYSSISIGDIHTPPGYLYWVIGATTGWSTPTAAQITEGKVAAGTAAPWSGYEIDTGTDGFVIEQTTITDFVDATDYTLAWVWYDGIYYSNIEEFAFTYTSGSSTPVLSGITLISIGTTFGTPRVTITF